MSRPCVRSENYSITYPHQYEMGASAANGVLDADGGAAQANYEAATDMWNAAPPHADPVLMAMLAGYRDTMREHAERGNDV